MMQEGVCPRCQTAFRGRLHCPICGAGLMDPNLITGEIHHIRTTPPPARPDGLPHRLLVGLCLAQALYYGMRQLVAAGLAWEGLPPSWWESVTGTLTMQTLQGGALVIGAVLASAGRGMGVGVGAVLGIANAALLLLPLALRTAMPSDSELWGLWVSQLSFGAFGGALGSRIWRPFPEFLTGTYTGSSIMILGTNPDRKLTIAWGRILVGMGFALVGVLSADSVFERLLIRGEGLFHVGSVEQARFVTWEIGALAVLVGGAWAGATARHGLLQGFMMGLLTGTLLIIIFASQGATDLPAYQFLLSLAGRPIEEGMAFRDLVALVGGSTLLIGTLGGWLGGTLFPSLAPR